MKPRNLLAIAFALSASEAAFAQFVVQTGTNAERVVELSRRAVSAWEEPLWVAMGWSESRTPTAVFGEPPLFAAVAREGQPMPAGETGTLGYMGFNPGTLDSSGRVAFVADVDGAERNQGVFFADANGLKVVAMGCGAIGGYGSTADCGDPSPIGGTFSGMFGGTVPAPAANDEGDVLFLADLVGASAPRGLFLYRSQDEAIIKIAAVGDPSPRGGTLTAVGSGVINNVGTIAFVASSFGDGSQGADILLWQDGVLSTYLATGDAAPDGEVFTLIGTEAGGYVDGTWIPMSVPALNDDNQLAFRAHTPTGGGLYVSRNGVHERVVRWGDPEPGGGVFFDFLAYPVINGRGEIAFLAYTSESEGSPPTGGAWFVGTQGHLRRVLGDYDPLPNGHVYGFAYSRNPFRPLDDAGNLVVYARYRMADKSERDSIVAVRPYGTPTVLVEEGTPTTVGGTWGMINPWPTSNNAFQVQFQAGTPGFFGSTHGQFVATYQTDSVFADGFENPPPK